MSHFTSVTPRLPVRDLRRTVAFYEEHLSFAVVTRWPEQDPTFCILRRDDVQLGFFVSEEARSPARRAEIYLEVSGVGALHERLRPRLPAEWGPEVYWYGRREFAVRDPDHYLLIFTEETDDPATCLDE